MTRYRVCYQEVNGWNFYDADSRDHALNEARKRKAAGAYSAYVLNMETGEEVYV